MKRLGTGDKEWELVAMKGAVWKCDYYDEILFNMSTKF